MALRAFCEVERVVMGGPRHYLIIGNDFNKSD